jgi:molybdopterin-guanine dinucleotide biosynthesis protein A
MYGNLGLPVVADRFPGLGPLAGIETALRATVAEWNLVVACDMPALDVSILEKLFEAAGSGDCAVPSYSDGQVEPLCAVFHTRCHAAVLKALDDGVRKVTEALRRLDLQYVRVEKADSFANLNTPEDLERFRNG